VGFALQGDAASAVKALADTPSASFAGDDADFRSCMMSRFGAGAQSPADVTVPDTWITMLAKNYIAYWQRALTKPDERDAAEQELRSATGKLLGHPVADDNAFDSAEDEITTHAEKLGFHVLLGRTAPLRELMLWKKTTVEQRQVNLPETQDSVTVNFLDDFVLRGWGYYATCGRRSAGGWATKQGLFAVVPAYKSIQDETFSVRFLAHESQHFADKQAFKNLESWELEYRAKLAELALADVSQASTVELICENRSASKDSPHGYADSRVVDDVTKFSRLQPADMCDGKTLIGQRLRDAAKQVLLEDSRKRLLQMQETNIHPDIRKLDTQKLGFTGYPPMTYEHVFLSCPSEEACTRTDKFRIDPMPPGCCILTVSNGDGRGTDEVRSYEIVLNDQRVASSHTRHTNVTVKLRASNTIRVILSGGPQSKLSVLIVYDPRQSK
jgi:hypothetical protein